MSEADQASRKRLGGYSIVKELGSGGFGAVYLARHPTLKKDVALKILHTGLDDAAIQQKFQMEAELYALLDSHPNIITVYDRGSTDGKLWIAMQYIPGTDAQRAIHSGPLAPQRAVRIIAETARALDYAHAHGILHRDIKPANILLASPDAGSEQVLLTDFGIAKALGNRPGLSNESAIILSPAYAAPEQFDGKALASSDIYGLGCTLYMLLTGQEPYAGAHGYQLEYAHKYAPIPKPSEIAHVPTAFDSIVARALAKDPAERYHTPGELAAAALRALGGFGPPKAPPITGALAKQKYQDAKHLASSDRGQAAVAFEEAANTMDPKWRAKAMLSLGDIRFKQRDKSRAYAAYLAVHESGQTKWARKAERRLKEFRPHRLARTAQVTGILAVLTSWILIGGVLGLIAIILASVGLSKYKNNKAGGLRLCFTAILLGLVAIIAATTMAVYFYEPRQRQ